MEVEQMNTNDLSSSNEYRKSLPRRKSLSEFDPSLGNEIQSLLKAAERNSAVAPDLAKVVKLGDTVPVFNKLAFESSQHSTEERKRNISEGMQWIRTQLKSLKEQDKALMRQFLDLRTSINQFKEDIDPYDDMKYAPPKRSMSMMDHLNKEKRMTRFGLARRLIEDINVVEEMTDSDEEYCAEESLVNQGALTRGRPITPSVSVAAANVRPPSQLIRGTPFPSVNRPVSDSSKYAKDDRVVTRRVRSIIWPPQIRLENKETSEFEDTRL